MTDHIDTDAVRAWAEAATSWVFSSSSNEDFDSVCRIIEVAPALCDELDRTREALRPFAEYATAMMDGLPDHVAVARIDLPKLAHVEITRADIYAARAALTEGNTERPETCPTCGSRDRAYCNNVRAQASWVTCADPWHSDLGAEER